jgi:mannose-6-phosphate isomerase-like protein (cupin superfamily)
MAFKFKAEKLDKSWGYELIRINNKEEDYCSKILYIKAGSATSMHYHLKKHETFYVRKGTLHITLINPQTTEHTVETLEEGDCFVIPRGQAHQLSADKDSPVEFDETSTYSDPLDSLRVWQYTGMII